MIYYTRVSTKLLPCNGGFSVQFNVMIVQQLLFNNNWKHVVVCKMV